MIVNYNAQKEEAALCFSAFSGFQVTAKLTALCAEMGVLERDPDISASKYDQLQNSLHF